MAQVILFARMEALLDESEKDFQQAVKAKQFVDEIREFNEILFGLQRAIGRTAKPSRNGSLSSMTHHRQ